MSALNPSTPQSTSEPMASTLPPRSATIPSKPWSRRSISALCSVILCINTPFSSCVPLNLASNIAVACCRYGVRYAVCSSSAERVCGLSQLANSPARASCSHTLTLSEPHPPQQLLRSSSSPPQPPRPSHSNPQSPFSPTQSPQIPSCTLPPISRSVVSILLRVL